jgi:hypothetical protein
VNVHCHLKTVFEILLWRWLAVEVEEEEQSEVGEREDSSELDDAVRAVRGS